MVASSADKKIAVSVVSLVAVNVVNYFVFVKLASQCFFRNRYVLSFTSTLGVKNMNVASTVLFFSDIVMVLWTGVKLSSAWNRTKSVFCFSSTRIGVINNTTKRANFSAFSYLPQFCIFIRHLI